MRRLVLALWAVTGCSVNPDDILPVAGAVVDARGPVVGHEVRLLRWMPVVGQPCERPPSPELLARARTDADGGFRFELLRAQVQSLVGFPPACLTVETDFTSGVHARTETFQLVQAVRIPPFRDWAPDVAISGRAVAFTTLPGVDGAAYRMTLRGPDGGAVWVEDLDPVPGGVRRTLPLREETVEDVEVRASLEALTPRDAVEPPLIGGPAVVPLMVHLEVATGLVLEARAPPVSRGAACPGVAAPCPLTDGDLSAGVAPGGGPITVELGTPTPVRAIVLRGLRTDGTVVIASAAVDRGLAEVRAALRPSAYELATSPSSFRVLPDGGLGTIPLRYDVVLRFDGGVVASAVQLAVEAGLPGLVVPLEQLAELSVVAD